MMFVRFLGSGGGANRLPHLHSPKIPQTPTLGTAVPQPHVTKCLAETCPNVLCSVECYVVVGESGPMLSLKHFGGFRNRICYCCVHTPWAKKIAILF